MDDKTRIRSILQSNLDMVISTADEHGKPWITPVSFTFDDQNKLYWVSSKDAKHSVNIKHRKDVAIVIYMHEPPIDALYIEAEAEELTDETEILRSIKVRSSRAQPKQYEVKSLDEVTGEAAWRMYKATPKTMYVREHVVVRNQDVTIRRKVA